MIHRTKGRLDWHIQILLLGEPGTRSVNWRIELEEPEMRNHELGIVGEIFGTGASLEQRQDSYLGESWQLLCHPSLHFLGAPGATCQSSCHKTCQPCLQPLHA